MLVAGVRPAPARPEAVEGGDPGGSREVAVRGPAHPGRAQLEAQVRGQPPGRVEERVGSDRGLEGRAVEAALDGEAHPRVDRAVAADRLGHALGLFARPGPGVHHQLRRFRDDVRRAAGPGDTRGERRAAGRLGDALQEEDEPRHLGQGRSTLLRLQARVRGPAAEADLEGAAALPRHLGRPVLRRLEDEHPAMAARHAQGQLAGGSRAHLLVGHEQQRDRLGPRLANHGGQHGHADDDAGLHVEDSGAVRAAPVEPPGHLGERPHRPDGVQVAEEQRAPLPEGDRGQQGVPARRAGAQLRGNAPLAKGVVDPGRELRDAGGVPARALEAHERLEVADEPRQVGLESREPAGRHGRQS